MTVRTLNLSHIVLASSDVSRIAHFFREIFNILPQYENEEFADFVFPSGARIAFFKPTGKTQLYFNADSARKSFAIGVTVDDIDRFFELCSLRAQDLQLSFSGPPKEHPWGEKSFLLIDHEQNRWEITASPSNSGVLVNR